MGQGVIHNVRAVLTVVPTPPSTFIAIATLIRHEPMLDVYVSTRFADPLTLIATVESWMLHGTDHWFLDPEVWSSIAPSSQATILDDIPHGIHSISKFYSKTIFNQLKRDIIASLESSSLMSDVEITQLKAAIAPWTDHNKDSAG